MLFNSFEFLVFLPVVFVSYFILPHKFRWLLLLASSYLFYAFWEWKYLSLILLSTFVDFAVAKSLNRAETPFKRRLLLGVSLLTNLGILISFKYANFFIDNANSAFEILGMEYMLPYTGFLLPMGISFYTFQTMAYTIDVYNRKAEVEHHFGYFALYVSYFPQLVAGPIERAQSLIVQLKQKSKLEPKNLFLGTQMIIWGLFKKMVIADRLGAIVSMVYDQPHEPSGIRVVLATILFAIQIYCDFSGYSDIAIGVARLFGVKLMDNFKTPYWSKSISEFWSRWHISLSTWFRDYLYIPLGGNRVGRSRWVINIMLVFVVSGFWHGANWTFIIWGALHGIYLLLERFIPSPPFFRKFRVVLTFVLVCLAWLFFRASSLDNAVDLLGQLASLNLSAALALLGTFGLSKFAFLLVLSGLFFAIDPLIDKIHKLEKPSTKWTPLLYGVLLAGIFLFGNFGELSFIYFQF